jgi:chromosome segregation ATPase
VDFSGIGTGTAAFCLVRGPKSRFSYGQYDIYLMCQFLSRGFRRLSSSWRQLGRTNSMANVLDGAIDRFNQAVERLDSALEQAGGRVGAALAPSQKEVQALQDDRTRLAEQLDQARSDYAALQTVTDQVEGRIDTAIENIRLMMRS